MNDLQAILRLKWGDIRALDALVERYQVRAGRWALTIHEFHNTETGERLSGDWAYTFAVEP